MSESKEDPIFEAIQLLSGEIYIFRNGFKEEAKIEDVFRFNTEIYKNNQVVYRFSRFDFNPAKPAKDSPIRLNRGVIAFAWYIDPKSEVIRNLKDAETQMNAKQAGIVLPG